MTCLHAPAVSVASCALAPTKPWSRGAKSMAAPKMSWANAIPKQSPATCRVRCKATPSGRAWLGQAQLKQHPQGEHGWGKRSHYYTPLRVHTVVYSSGCACPSHVRPGMERHLFLVLLNQLIHHVANFVPGMVLII